MFFTKGIVDICEKKLPAGEKPFYLFGEKEGNRLVHIVYCGGDDLFLVGAWDDLLELSADLRKAFAAYTNGMLSFSAGLGLFSPTYPVIRMAEDSGALEDRAKKEPGKDSPCFPIEKKSPRKGTKTNGTEWILQESIETYSAP